jgi:AbrB family looped-hinge helix DNA binding protein
MEKHIIYVNRTMKTDKGEVKQTGVSRVWTVSVVRKGQITVPAALRRTLDLHPGVSVDFSPSGDGAFVATARRKSRILDFAGDLAHSGSESSREEAPGKRDTGVHLR